MAKQPVGPEDGSGELFTREGLLPTAEALPGESLISAPEQAAHLISTLGYYDTAALQEGFLRMAENPEWRSALETRYGRGGAQKMLLGKMVQHQEVLDKARGEFMAAYGLNLRIDANPEQREQLEAEAERQYANFHNSYRGESDARRQKRQEYRTILAAKIAGGTAVEPETDSAPAPEKSRFDPAARVSLARALRPEFQGLRAEDYRDIPDRLLVYVAPTNLVRSLVNVGGRTTNALAYQPDESLTRRLAYVTVSPAEWDIMLRASAERTGFKAVNASEKAQRKLPPDEADTDAPRRAGIHIVESAENSMQTYMDNVLKPNLDLIRRFQEASRYNAGLARFGNEANMRLQMRYLWDFVIDEMLWSVRMVEKWTPEQEKLAYRALEKVVFLSETPAVRNSSFKMLLDSLETWTLAKQHYINAKLAETNRYIFNHQTEEERQARAEHLHPATAA